VNELRDRIVIAAVTCFQVPGEKLTIVLDVCHATDSAYIGIY